MSLTRHFAFLTSIHRQIRSVHVDCIFFSCFTPSSTEIDVVQREHWSRDRDTARSRSYSPSRDSSTSSRFHGRTHAATSPPRWSRVSRKKEIFDGEAVAQEKLPTSRCVVESRDRRIVGYSLSKTWRTRRIPKRPSPRIWLSPSIKWPARS